MSSNARRFVPDTATPVLPTARVTVQLAEPGAGKTFQARRLAWAWPRVLYLDSQIVGGVAEYPGIVARDLDELLRRLYALAQQRAERWRVAFRGEVTDDVLNVAASLPGTLVVAEEADKYCSADYTPGGLYAIAHHGRRAGTGLVLNARRASSIARDLTATADSFRVWAQSEPIDREAVRKRGFPLAVLDGLGQHEYAEKSRDSSGRVNWAVVKVSGARVPFAPASL